MSLKTILLADPLMNRAGACKSMLRIELGASKVRIVALLG